MPTAYLQLPDHMSDRSHAFSDGCAQLGFVVNLGSPVSRLRHDDVVITWNLSARSYHSAQMAREGGGAHIVAENGYTGFDEHGQQHYAMALEGHCGSGRWFAPDDSRLKKLDIDFQPWRNTAHRKALVAEQRGIGSSLMKSPAHYGTSIVRELQKRGVEGIIRPHPGAVKDANGPLMEALDGLDSLVVWSSNCATEALINGVPVYYSAPHIITAGAASKFATYGNHNFTDEARYAAFSRLAWAQWTLDEIASGEAIDTLLQVHRGRLPACPKV